MANGRLPSPRPSQRVHLNTLAGLGNQTKALFGFAALSESDQRCGSYCLPIDCGVMRHERARSTTMSFLPRDPRVRASL